MGQGSVARMVLMEHRERSVRNPSQRRVPRGSRRAGGRAGQEMEHGHPHGGRGATWLILGVREGALGDPRAVAPATPQSRPFPAFNDCAHLSYLLLSI